MGNLLSNRSNSSEIDSTLTFDDVWKNVISPDIPLMIFDFVISSTKIEKREQVFMRLLGIDTRARSILLDPSLNRDLMKLIPMIYPVPPNFPKDVIKNLKFSSIGCATSLGGPLTFFMGGKRKSSEKVVVERKDVKEFLTPVIKEIFSCKNLHTLEIISPQIDLPSFRFEKLETLSVREIYGDDDKFLKKISYAKNLKNLSLNIIGPKINSFKCFSDLPLRTVNLSVVDLSLLDSFKGLTQIESLTLSDCEVNENLLYTLNSLTKLSVLMLNHVVESDHEYEDVSLRTLNFLSPLVTLVSLSLDSIGEIYGDDSINLTPLSNLTNLTTLNIRYSRVNSLIPLNLLKSLSGSKLKSLSLIGNIVEDGIDFVQG